MQAEHFHSDLKIVVIKEFTESAIDVFSVSDTDDEYTELHIVKFANDAVITDTISPKIA
jgi:hypothetical protein